jgi:hypothetical protein
MKPVSRMVRNVSEAHIRDLLASGLSVLEPGLELLDIEKYIPSTLGTRSFLDLLAKDRSGHWVIIEVKKTDAAAREAAHEIFKYAEAVQRHFGARSDEIRVIVASVEWKELLIPFSRLKTETRISVDGFRLGLDADGKTLRATLVETIPVNRGRYLAPWHQINLYCDRDSLGRGIASYDKCCHQKGIEDYVLVILKAAEDFNERAAATLGIALQSVDAMFVSDTPEDNDAPDKFPLERYEYILYFATQILSKELCLEIIARESALFEEVAAYTEGMSVEEELCALHTNVYDVDPTPFRDYFEIGYAAKFKSKLLRDEGWTVDEVLRRGMFARNDLLSDDAIIDELKGSTGSSHQSLKRTVSMSNSAHVSSVRADLAVALAANPGWLAQINRVLDDVSKATPAASVEMSVFCPSSGVFTLYFVATDEDPTTHMPYYCVAVRNAVGQLVRLYVGLLAPAGQPATLNDILAKYYDGRTGMLMVVANTAGFYETRDADVMEDLGLVYRSFRLDDPDVGTDWHELKDDRWRAITPTLPF